MAVFIAKMSVIKFWGFLGFRCFVCFLLVNLLLRLTSRGDKTQMLRQIKQVVFVNAEKNIQKPWSFTVRP